MPPDFFQRIQRSPIPVPKTDMEAEHEDFAQESPFLPEKPVGFRGVPYKVKVFFFRGVLRNHASRWSREVPKLAPGRPGGKVEKREVLFDPFRI